MRRGDRSQLSGAIVKDSVRIVSFVDVVSTLRGGGVGLAYAIASAVSTSAVASLRHIVPQATPSILTAVLKELKPCVCLALAEASDLLFVSASLSPPALRQGGTPLQRHCRSGVA